MQILLAGFLQPFSKPGVQLLGVSLPTFQNCTVAKDHGQEPSLTGPLSLSPKHTYLQEPGISGLSAEELVTVDKSSSYHLRCTLAVLSTMERKHVGKNKTEHAICKYILYMLSFVTMPTSHEMGTK